MRVGTGYDVHRLVEGRPLIIGGVNIPYEKGLLGHSDADVLLHAIMDALLGAAALGDGFVRQSHWIIASDSLSDRRRKAQPANQTAFSPTLSASATDLIDTPPI